MKPEILLLFIVPFLAQGQDPWKNVYSQPAWEARDKWQRPDELIRLLASWPRTVAAAAVAHEPHRIAFYVHDLAAAFHGFWAKGKDDHSLRFVNPADPKLTLARLALVDAVRQVIRNGLGILGVSAPEELS